MERERRGTDMNLPMRDGRNRDSLSAAISNKSRPRHGGSFAGLQKRGINHMSSDSGSIALRSNRDSRMMESDTSSMMVRETFSVADSRSHLSVVQQTRLVDNTRLSALTN